MYAHNFTTNLDDDFNESFRNFIVIPTNIQLES